MERFVKGDIVVLPFPFSDLSDAKRRPALVLAALAGDDIILCQITSQNIRDNYPIPLYNSDCETGSLNKISNIRPNRIFTADRRIVINKIGILNRAKINSVIKRIVDIFEKD